MGETPPLDHPWSSTVWVVDRVEPPFAVLVARSATVDVLVSDLPLGVAEGDILQGRAGPVWHDARRHRLAELEERMRRLMAPGPRGEHGAPHPNSGQERDK